MWQGLELRRRLRLRAALEGGSSSWCLPTGYWGPLPIILGQGGHSEPWQPGLTSRRDKCALSILTGGSKRRHIKHQILKTVMD